MVDEKKVEEKSESQAVTSLTDLYKLEREKEVVTGLKIKLKVLDYGEHLEVLSMLSRKDLTTNVVLQNHMFQLQTLKRATVSINDKIYDEKSRDELIDYFKSLPLKVMSAVNDFYSELAAEQDKIVESIKKK